MRDYNRHYTRAGANPSGTDIKTYDVGNFSLIVSGVAAGQIGELYVEYDIDFFDPRVPVPIGQNLQMWHAASGSGAATDAAPLTGAAARAGSTLAVVLTSTASITIPAVGRYLVCATIGSAAITASPTMTAGANVTGASIINNNATFGLNGFVVNTQGAIVAVFDVTAPNGVIALTAGTGVLAGNYDVFVSQISSGLTSPLHGFIPFSVTDVEDLNEALTRWREQKKDWESGKAPRPIVVDQSDDEKDGFTKVSGLVPPRSERQVNASVAPTTSSAASAGAPKGTPVKRSA